MLRKLIALPLSAVAVAGAAAALAGPASAAGSTTTIKQDVRSYTSPSDASAPVHRLKAGTVVETICFRGGEELGDNGLWFLIRKDGAVGYVHRDAIVPPSELRSC